MISPFRAPRANIANVALKIQGATHGLFCNLHLNQCSSRVFQSLTSCKLCFTHIFIPNNHTRELRIYVNSMSKKLIFVVLLTFLCFYQKKLGKVGEKQSIMSLSTWDRESSPLGSKFNQGRGKPRPWLKS